MRPTLSSSSSPLAPVLETNISLHKILTVSRGLNYHYFFSPPRGVKPTLVFLHGYSSTSYDWHHQTTFFRDRGYGVLVPDMLGYGQTAKPMDMHAYILSLVSQDIVDLVKAENLSNLIVVGHEWGSAVVSRIANYHPDVFAGCVFIGFGYVPPSPDFDIHHTVEDCNEVFGYELFGFWPFMAHDDADKIIKAHKDSASILPLPDKPDLWRTELGLLHTTETQMAEDRRDPLPIHRHKNDSPDVSSSNQRKHDVRASESWYEAAVESLAHDDKGIPLDAYMVRSPVFFAQTEEYSCHHKAQMAVGKQLCPLMTSKKYDGNGHIQISHAEELNADLVRWIERVVFIAPRL